MQRAGEVEGRIRIAVLHLQHQPQLVPAQRHLVQGLKRVGPHGAGVLVVRQAQLHSRLRVVRPDVCRRAQDAPGHVAREAVLLHLRAGAEAGKAEGHAPSNRLAPVQNRVRAQEQDLVARGLREAGHRRAVQVHLRADPVLMGQHSLDQAAWAGSKSDAARDAVLRVQLRRLCLRLAHGRCSGDQAVAAVARTRAPVPRLASGQSWQASKRNHCASHVPATDGARVSCPLGHAALGRAPERGGEEWRYLYSR